jgi:hypothetical protein
MDERKLAELMTDAVAETPPPTFDQDDVARASERLRVRRRNTVIAGSAASVAVLASASVLAVALWSGTNSEGGATQAAREASSSNGNAAPYEVPEEDSAASAKTQRDENVPSETPKQGGSSSGNAGPAGPGGTPSGCGQADRELAAALAGELPAAAAIDRDAPQPVVLECPHESLGAAFSVHEGDRTGVVSVVLVQPDVTTPTWQLAEGAHRARATTPHGATVLVVTEPADGSAAPLTENLDAIAAGVAEEY